MGPLMYKQRPAYPALIGAGAVLALGGLICWGLNDRLQDGVGSFSSILLVMCTCIGIAGALLIAAFARYQFTHLWKSTGARHSNVYKTQTVQEMRRHSSVR